MPALHVENPGPGYMHHGFAVVDDGGAIERVIPTLAWGFVNMQFAVAEENAAPWMMTGDVWRTEPEAFLAAAKCLIVANRDFDCGWALVSASDAAQFIVAAEQAAAEAFKVRFRTTGRTPR